MSDLTISIVRPAASPRDTPGQRRHGGHAAKKIGEGCPPGFWEKWPQTLVPSASDLSHRGGTRREFGRVAGQLAQLALPRYPYDRLARRRSNAYASPAQRAEA